MPGGRASKPLLFGSEALAELLHLVAALDGGFSGVMGEFVAAAGSDGEGNLVPLIGFELAAFEGVPFLLVSLDEVDGFQVSPGDRLGFFGSGDCGNWGGLRV